MSTYKFIRSGFPVIILGALFFGLAACSRFKPINQDGTGEPLSQAQVKVFTCPMHPLVTQNKAGDCPVCGMSLIEKPGQAAKMNIRSYVCSMHPDVIRDKPGDCPICGMALIDKVCGDGSLADTLLNTVVLPVNESVLASVQTVCITCEELPITIEAPGIINYDSRSVKTVSAHYRGLIEKSYIKYKFQPVHKGQKIYDIYCPDIYLTHMNYVNLLKKLPDQPEVTREAHEWLVQIGLNDQQIDKLIKDEKIDFHLSAYSDFDGFVVGSDFDPETGFSFEGNSSSAAGQPATADFVSGLSEGAVVEAGTPLYKVVNLESVRADLKIRTQDAVLLKVGQKVNLIDVVSPGTIIKAKISLIEPLNGGLFQVVRAYIPNGGRKLYPGMKIQARINTGIHKSMWIPNKAVINLGQHQAVFLLQDNAFIATEVKTGMRSGDKIEICSGTGQEAIIAANASLLTDSDGFIKTNAR